MKRIATMYLLDWRGNVINTRYTEYHSRDWENLIALGYVTHVVSEVAL